jgi:transposase InsO family protein
VTQSMGAVGTSADIALAESINATLKRELLQDAACWPDELTCRRQVFRWLVRYNTRRRHSWCRYSHQPATKPSTLLRSSQPHKPTRVHVPGVRRRLCLGGPVPFACVPEAVGRYLMATTPTSPAPPGPVETRTP